jgi:hypothetical protein
MEKSPSPPSGTLRAVFQNNASVQQFLADAVSFAIIFACTGKEALLNHLLNTLRGKHGISRSRTILEILL